jgi:hypothetical protein
MAPARHLSQGADFELDTRTPRGHPAGSMEREEPRGPEGKSG